MMDEIERQSEERGWATAKTLAEALPYIQIYDRETVVIKYGGHAMGETAVAKQFAADVVLLKLMGVNPVVVHGGGPQISAMLDKAGVKSNFIDGLRVTDKDTMIVAEMVLSGAVNKEIAHWISVAGKEADVRGIGLSGKDAGLLTVEKTTRTRRDPDSLIEHEVDLGFVGEPTKVDPKLIAGLIASETDDWVPVIAPIGVAEDGQTYNVNADTVAGAVAGALSAKRMLLLTDVKGVLDKNGDIIRQMTVADAKALIDDGTASGGMIPKLQTAMAAVRAGRRGRGHPGWPPSPRYAGRAVHRIRRWNAGEGVTAEPMSAELRATLGDRRAGDRTLRRPDRDRCLAVRPGRHPLSARAPRF
jgi:acetylglutamate kinase